ncbi:SpoIIE family protein phosphatase [Dactylosporangium sp. NPDC050688]|uniref:SpoIIE family protein phosphatase n=1 Tax=Dactylosporangium sp. NPDC050688 TaxID=3157217 RepID=UPI0033C967D6
MQAGLLGDDPTLGEGAARLVLGVRPVRVAGQRRISHRGARGCCRPYARRRQERDRSVSRTASPYAAGIDLSGTSMMAAMLGAVEDAAPVDAIEAIMRELAKSLDARSVSFLIADLGGRALVRLTHAPRGTAADAPGDRRGGDEVATVLPLDGQVEPLDLPRSFPLGMVPDATFQTGDVTLQAGDRLVIVTDGMRERGAAQLDLNAELLRVADLHPREATRALADAVLRVAGPVLADDATLLIIDWYNDHGRARHTSAGADQAPTSAARPS